MDLYKVAVYLPVWGVLCVFWDWWSLLDSWFKLTTNHTSPFLLAGDMHSLSLWHHPHFFSPLSHTGIILSLFSRYWSLLYPVIIVYKTSIQRNRYFSCLPSCSWFSSAFFMLFYWYVLISVTGSLSRFVLFFFNLIHLSFSLKFFSNSVSFICFCSSCIFLASVNSFYNVICVHIILSWSCEGRRVGTCFTFNPFLLAGCLPELSGWFSGTWLAFLHTHLSFYFWILFLQLNVGFLE